MNGIHDMGGMHGLGAIEHAPDEPVFHARWEGRVAALMRTIAAWRRWPGDAIRYRMECMPADAYLRASYYERWLVGLTDLLLETGMISRVELETGGVAPGVPRQAPALAADDVGAALVTNFPWSRPGSEPARFGPGDPVRARNLNPIGHTRLPRYVRGKAGTIVRSRGMRVSPGDGAIGAADTAQHLYLVRFGARELWGDAARAQDSVHLELYDGYLDPG